MPPQLEKNHVVPTAWQDEALARDGVSREVPCSAQFLRLHLLHQLLQPPLEIALKAYVVLKYHDLGQAPGDDLRHKVGVGAWLFRPGLSSSPTWLTLTDTPGFSYRPIAQPWLCRSAAPKPAGASHGLGIETPTPGSSIQGPPGSQSCPPSRSGEKSEHLLQS